MAGRLFFVTGASGFIGNALCRRLQTLGRVRALVRRPAAGPWDETVVADLATDELARDAFAGVDVVFHLAGKAHAVGAAESDDAGHRALTVEGTRGLLDACRSAGVARLVFLSSVKAMGEGGPHALDESSTPAPRSEYGKSRREAEELVLGRGDVAHAAVLRLTPVYGPGHRGNLARMIEAVDRGRFPPLPRVRNRRSMIHVDDVVSATLLAAERPAAAGRVLIVSDGREYSTREIYEWICAALGVGVPRWTVSRSFLCALARAGDALGRIRGRPAPFDSDAYDKLFGSAVYDTSAAREALGFVPQWNLESALPAMVDAWRQSSRGVGVTAAREG